MPFLGLLLKFLPTFLKLIGVAGQVEALVSAYEARKKQQAEADTPITKKEISDAADKGQL